jgi:hypothetical protein
MTYFIIDSEDFIELFSENVLGLNNLIEIRWHNIQMFLNVKHIFCPFY